MTESKADITNDYDKTPGKSLQERNREIHERVQEHNREIHEKVQERNNEFHEKIEEIKEEVEKKIKIPWINSISSRIFFMTLIAVFCVAGAVMLSSSYSSRRSMKNIIRNYMIDEAELCKTIVEDSLDSRGEEGTYEYDYLNDRFKDIKIGMLPTSYVYIVRSGGEMLYHPDENKVGQPVANEVIKEVATDIAAGKTVDDKFVEYKYKGAMKYVAYAIAGDNECIVIATADEKDTLKCVNDMTKYNSVCAVIITVVIGIINFFIGRQLCAPIVRVTDAIFKLGNLEIREDPYIKQMMKRKDESGYMARAIDGITESLGNVITDVRKQSETLYDTSVSVSENAGDTVQSVKQVELAVSEVAEGATSQAEETADATNNVMSMGELIELSNSDVEKLKLSSEEISQAVKEATEILGELLDINAKAVESIDMIYDRTNTTNKSVEDIKAAITIITSIAEETNLLSLNASIEAARAGEQGRGFAVVASQIQKLAEQSNESAKQIEDITERLIEDSQQAVTGMQEVRSIMDSQSTNVKNTNSAFDKVKDNIKVSIEGIRELAETTVKLDSARGAVTDVVQNLSAIAQENAASSQECSASVTEVCTIMDKVTEQTVKLREIAEAIDGNMKRFTV